MIKAGELNKLKKCKKCDKFYPIQFYNPHIGNYCYDCKVEVKREMDKRYRDKYREKLNQKKNEQYREGREWKCQYCEKKFKRPIWHSHKYCNRKCFEMDSREKRKGKGNPAYRNGLRIQGTYTVKHMRACAKYRKEFLKKYDYLFCEHCKTNNALRFETHHIVWASEAPKHPELHNTKNLILLCILCHNDFHRHKDLRKYLVEERKLKELFSTGSKILIRL